MRRKVWYLTSLTSSGKTTLMKFIQATGFMVVDTSVLLTRWGESHPADRRTIRFAIHNGFAVSDDIVNNAVSSFLATNLGIDCLIAGYPRTEGQAKFAIEVLDHDPHNDQHFIHLNTPEPVCRDRFDASRTNGDRGERPDGDTEKAAENRFNRDAKNIPLTIGYLDTCGLRGRYHEIIGVLPKEEVSEQLQEVMGRKVMTAV